MITDDVIKKWLIDNPPENWDFPNGNWKEGVERKFGRVGLFMKYNSAEHVEQRNMIAIRICVHCGKEHYEGELRDNYFPICQCSNYKPKVVPFGYCNNKWQKMKEMMQENDEIWRYGGSSGETIIWVRNGEIVNELVSIYY